MSSVGELYRFEDYNGHGTRLTFPSESTAVRLVQRIATHSAFCQWCLAPVQRDHRINGLHLSTVATFDQYANLTGDVPPDRVDDAGETIAVSREEVKICDCGVIDLDPGETRSKETVYQALEHVCALLEENGADVDYAVAEANTEKAFEKGHTGQLEQTLGTAIYQAVG